jgi:hypothetical protein
MTILCKVSTWPRPALRPWPCDKPAKFTVTGITGSRHVCGRHVKRWRVYETTDGPLRVTIGPVKA